MVGSFVGLKGRGSGSSTSKNVTKVSTARKLVGQDLDLSGGGGVLHRDYRRGLIPSNELHSVQDDVGGEDVDVFDYISMIRFPPPCASILRKRLADCFTITTQMWDPAVKRQPVLPNLSPRGPLGLSVTPTPLDDYRRFDIHIDLLNDDDIAIMRSWIPSFQPALFPYIPYGTGPGVKTETNKAPKAKSRAKKAQGAPVQSGGTPTPEEAEPIGTIYLMGLLVELPNVVEAYKTLDMEVLVKSANISQMIVCCFPEHRHLYFPGASDWPVPAHNPSSVVEPVASSKPPSQPAAPVNRNFMHKCADVLIDRSDFTVDPKVLELPRCPWLWPSGVSPSLQLWRERRFRDLSQFYTKQEIQETEMNMISLLERGRLEYTIVEVGSALEGYLQREALQRNTSVPQAEQVVDLSGGGFLAGGSDSKLCYVITEQPTDIFDDAKSNLSDELFGDEHLDPLDLLESVTLQNSKKRKDRKTGGSSTPGAINVGGQYGAGYPGGYGTTYGAAGGYGTGSLESEFNALAQSEARNKLAEELEAELGDEFYSGALIDDTNLLGLPSDEHDEIVEDITAIRKIDKNTLKKTRKQKPTRPSS